jgi:hypothetical protein
MSEYMEAYIDLSDCNPEVDKGLRNCRGEYDAIRISHRNVMIRLSPSTVSRAFVTLCENRIRESFIDCEGAKAIREYLEG